MTNYISKIMNAFKNMTLNAEGVDSELNSLILKRDIWKAISLMDNNDEEVDKAIREYNPQTHDVMHRRNKYREDDEPYITEKLPRTRARYINEIELFFLLGKPIEWKLRRGDEEAYAMFTQYLEGMHFNSRIRQAKRLAGSEIESAIIFNLTNAGGKVQSKSFVASRSKGYRLRPMFDQYGDLVALAYGYRLKENGKNILHYDILTSQYTHFCAYKNSGWEVDTFPNITNKINAVYFHQNKAWDGVVPRLNREEMLDSKIGDTNNYFADPMAAATADVIDSLAEPDKPGRLIQLSGQNSKFEYINPPQNSETRNAEMKNLSSSILFDTFTPDFSYENMKGLGTLSGTAMRNALILGYIKRDILKETYEELVRRLANVILAILKVEHPEMAKKFDELRIDFEFAEPFDDDKKNTWNSIAQLFSAGVISLETAVKMLALTDAPDDEVALIKMFGIEQTLAAQGGEEKNENA